MMRLCAEVGCPNITEATRCAEHAQLQEARQESGKWRSRDVYSNKRWRPTRKAVLRRDRFCRCPLDNCHGARECLHVATQADHIIPIERDGAPDPFDTSNIRGVCASCHTRITARGNPT